MRNSANRNDMSCFHAHSLEAELSKEDASTPLCLGASEKPLRQRSRLRGRAAMAMRRSNRRAHSVEVSNLFSQYRRAGGEEGLCERAERIAMCNTPIYIQPRTTLWRQPPVAFANLAAANGPAQRAWPAALRMMTGRRHSVCRSADRPSSSIVSRDAISRACWLLWLSLIHI